MLLLLLPAGYIVPFQEIHPVIWMEYGHPRQEILDHGHIFPVLLQQLLQQVGMLLILMEELFWELHPVIKTWFLHFTIMEYNQPAVHQALKQSFINGINH